MLLVKLGTRHCFELLLGKCLDPILKSNCNCLNSLWLVELALANVALALWLLDRPWWAGVRAWIAALLVICVFNVVALVVWEARAPEGQRWMPRIMMAVALVKFVPFAIEEEGTKAVIHDLAREQRLDGRSAPSGARLGLAHAPVHAHPFQFVT